MKFILTDYNDVDMKDDIIVEPRDGRNDMLTFKKGETEIEVRARDLESILEAMRVQDRWEDAMERKERGTG